MVTLFYSGPITNTLQFSQGLVNPTGGMSAHLRNHLALTDPGNGHTAPAHHPTTGWRHSISIYAFAALLMDSLQRDDFCHRGFVRSSKNK